MGPGLWAATPASSPTWLRSEPPQVIDRLYLELKQEGEDRILPLVTGGSDAP